MENLTRSKLSGMLVKKHRSIVRANKTELKSLKRLVVLQEKLDQLEHWIEDSEKPEKYLQRREDAAIELESLKKQFDCTTPVERHKILVIELEEHTKALEHWVEHERREA